MIRFGDRGPKPMKLPKAKVRQRVPALARLSILSDKAHTKSQGKRSTVHEGKEVLGKKRGALFEECVDVPRDIFPEQDPYKVDLAVLWSFPLALQVAMGIFAAEKVPKKHSVAVCVALKRLGNRRLMDDVRWWFQKTGEVSEQVASFARLDPKGRCLPEAVRLMEPDPVVIVPSGSTEQC